jgi:D-glycero-D-manno-heptose 1,7-bisphosphate phosphatase
MQKAVFIDKDGTIVDNSQYPYVIPADKLLGNVIEGLRYLQNLGYKLIIVSNQSWISKGRLTERQVEDIFLSVVEQLFAKGVFIDDYIYCPHTDADGCLCRKPKSGMLIEKMKEYSLQPENCYMVGDRADDIGTGINAGVKTVLVKTGCGESGEYQPDYVIDNLNAISSLKLGE